MDLVRAGVAHALAGCASSRRISSARIPTAMRPRSSAPGRRRTAPRRRRRRARPAPPRRSQDRASPPGLERQDHGVGRLDQAEVLDGRPRRVVAVADERRADPALAQRAEPRYRVVPQVDPVAEEPPIVVEELPRRAGSGATPAASSTARRSSSALAVRPDAPGRPRLDERADQVGLGEAEPFLDLGAEHRPVAPHERVVQVEEDGPDRRLTPSSPRIARTCSIVVRGFTKHRRATGSPFHDDGWTNPTCASSARRHHAS